MKPLLYADPIYLEHLTGEGHPETPQRLKHLYDVLDRHPVTGRYIWTENAPATLAQLARVHDADYLAAVAAYAQRSGGRIEADTVVSRRSFEVAAKAAGAAVDAVEQVLNDNALHAVCLSRPPGHHALKASAMGFCLINNVAVAAAHARDVFGLSRILIVDWDVHHGNGTQDLFYDDGSVCFMSAHRFPFYPGTGSSDETGTGKGQGMIFNLPLPFGLSRKEYLQRFESTLQLAAEKSRPELVLISAGFDAHAADPIGSLGLESEDFETLTNLVRGVANSHCQGRLVSLLEGGYNIEKLAESVIVHLETLATGPDVAAISP